MACIVSNNSNVRKNTLTQVSPSKNTSIQLAAMKEYTTMLLESYKNVPQNIAPSAHLLRIVFVRSPADFALMVGTLHVSHQLFVIILLLSIETLVVVHNSSQ